MESLSLRWSQELLQQLTLPPPVKGSSSDLAGQSRQAAQQWLAGEKLVPPLLLDELAALMPAAPLTLAALVPDPPWPWLLMGVLPQLEQAARQWQEAWLNRRYLLQDKFLDRQNGWPDRAIEWLRQQLAPARSGVVLLAQSYIAAVTELLQAFIEGVEQKLDEAELDLAEIDGKMGELAGAVTDSVATFPASPLAAVWMWGLHPRRWLLAWSECRQAQTLARNLAHLSRSRLLTWQTISYYEDMLPFYRQLLADWVKIAGLWERTCRQVSEASRTLSELDWAGQLKTGLAASSGPWTESLALELYQEAVGLNGERIWEQLETLTDWALESLEAEEIGQRLRDQTRQALRPVLALPVDGALRRQFPDDDLLAGWLAGLAEQARPFWRYDETALAEAARAQTRLDTWLLLPHGEASPVAAATANWPRPPVIRPSRKPDEVAVVTLRRIGQTMAGED